MPTCSAARVSGSSRAPGSTSATRASLPREAFFAAAAGQIPVVITRARDGELRAFLNVCRHRGHVVASGSGQRETMQCPYHAWTYGLDGRLRAAPRSDREPGFDADELGLKADPGGHLGPVRLREPRRRGGTAGRGARRRAVAARRDRRRRRTGVPLPRRVRARRELEDLLRELPRVLPLRRRPSRASARRSTCRPRRTGSRPTGSSRARSARSARTATRFSRTARCRAASSTSSGRTSASTSSPASRTCPAARCFRSAPSGQAASWTTSSRPTSTRAGSTSSWPSTTRSGRRTGPSSRASSAAFARAS